MPIAAIALAFDPSLRLGDRLVRLDTLVLAAGILGAILLAAWLAGRTSAYSTDDRLRADDLVFILLAAVPGAILGGRIGYALVHADYYAARPGVILDPGQGSLELGLAIVGGALTAGAAARLLGEPVGRWFHVAPIPLLLGIAVGKVAMALGGSGQGLPADLPWATSFLGPGPWGSLAPDLPSHPSQLYEAGVTLAVLAGVVVLLGRGAFAARDGRLFLWSLAAWFVARAAVGATWRDPTVAGPLRAEQLLSLAVAGACVTILVMTRSGRAPATVDSPRGSIVGGPDGEASGARHEL